MTRSDAVQDLSAALAAAQGEIVAARRDAENPHFRSRYADLGAVWDACRAALSKHGLAVVQSPRLDTTHDQVWFVEVETVLLHSSGQSIADTLAMPLAAPTAHGIGSALTYARRYALAAMVGVAPADEDDDGNAAVGAPPALDAGQPLGMENVTVRVMGIVKRPLGRGDAAKYVITGSDQHTYHTFKLDHANTAKAAQEAGQPIDVTYKTTKYGRDVVSLKVDDTDPPL